MTRRFVLVVTSFVCLLAACSAEQAFVPSDGQPITAVAPENDPADAPNAALESGPLSLVPIAKIEQPVDAALRDSDGAIYFVSRSGSIHRYIDGNLQTGSVLDLAELTEGDGERGLLGLAFSADGATAYLNYTNRDDDTTIASIAVAADGQFDRSSLRTITTIAQPFRNHNAGDLVVEPAGTLLVPMGDGGSANDPQRVSLDNSSLLGKVLRIDPATGTVTTIAKGLRNPWRVDLIDDRLWMADVGQNQWEEVSVLDRVSSQTGDNIVDFGWSAYEANDRFNGDQSSSSHTPPVLAYEHGENGCSISGGAVAVAGALRGRYVFADYCSGRVWSMPTNQKQPAKTLHFEAVDSPVAIVRAGEQLFVLSLSGTIWRLNG